MIKDLQCRYYLANTVGSYFAEIAKTIDRNCITKEEAESLQQKYLIDNPIISTSADFANCFYLILFALANTDLISAQSLIMENLHSGIRWIDKAKMAIDIFSRPMNYSEISLGHTFYGNQAWAQSIDNNVTSSTNIIITGE